MNLKKISTLLLFILLILNTSSCASTIITSHKIVNTEYNSEKKSALILWGCAWRKDQKEPKLREEIAEKALTRFFTTNSYFSDFKLLKDVNQKSSISLSDQDALSFAKNQEKNFDKIVFIRVEELGPLLHLNLGVVLIDGATEVSLRTRIIDIKTGALDYDESTHWSNGGPYIIKGIASLEQDMYDTLKSIFHD